MEASPSSNPQQSRTEHGDRPGKYSRNHNRRKKPDEPNSRDNLSNTDHNDDQNTGTHKPQKPILQRRSQLETPSNINGDSKKSNSRPPNKQRRKRKEEEGKTAQALETSTTQPLGPPSSSRDDRKGLTQPAVERDENIAKSSGNPPKPAQTGARRFGKAKFNAGLTTDPPTEVIEKTRPQRRRKNIPNEAGDLTSNLIRELSTYPYMDCLVCFSSIHPRQPTWSCSSLLPMLEVDPTRKSQYCWSTFHLKCIREWSEKNYKEVKAAWEAREEFGKGGEWRCPGCQGRRNKLPKEYVCFCGSTRSPNSHLATPHSCGNSCSRPRTSCSHPCPLLCHPGPCPPCKVIMDVVCECTRKQTIPARCGEHTQVSCGQTCSKMLSCGKHRCQEICHLGSCSPCERKDVLACWCGKERKDVMCGEGDVWLESLGCDDRSTEYTQEPRKGFGCHSVCENPFDCGEHTCMKSCHPPTLDSQPGHCPMSPDRIKTCPCGKKTIATSLFPQTGDFPARTRCADPIPTCASICLRPHADCEHLCQAKCHTSMACPPCSVDVVRPCRCGSTTKTLKCGNLRIFNKDSIEEKEIICDRPCTAMRACGKHQCNRVCCPLASLSKGKMKAVVPHTDVDFGGLHQCDLVCAKMLNCGIHQCEERDHKGYCHPCFRSSFEELTCFCSRTVLEPPIPCGTKVYCSYPCSLPPSPCGHPKTPHTCHFPDSSCPPCVHLTNKPCPCGKKILSNIRCSLGPEKLSCGSVCGKPLPCGGHKCDRPCHAGECGACTSMCGKARKSCFPDIHPCTNLCHAPTSCDEDEPCQTRVELTCECGRIRQAVVCGKCKSNPAGSAKGQTIKCTTECALKKRNAKLADALGIKAGGVAMLAEVTYSDELVAFARASPKFLTLVEDALAEFLKSTRSKQVLPHMPPEKRNFVYKLAGMYRLDSQMVDQDPHRSVQIIRRLDTRIPNPLLSSYIASKFAHNSTSSLGKLVSLRGLATTVSTSGISSNPVKPNSSLASGSGTPRGWMSVVASTPTPRSTTPVANTNSRLGTPTPPNPSATIISNVSTHGSAQENVPESWEDDV